MELGLRATDRVGKNRETDKRRHCQSWDLLTARKIQNNSSLTFKITVKKSDCFYITN